jgi:glutamine synthetase
MTCTPASERPKCLTMPASINSFSYGVADRGASIRVPHSFVKNGYKGYLEDRRPNSQGDPYQIASQILKTISSVPRPFAKVRNSASSSINLDGDQSMRSILFTATTK